jgi:hypothetical protein
LKTVLARVAAVAVAAIALSACSAINPITTQKHYQASDGVQVTITDDVRAINLLVMTTAKDAPAVLTGSLYNSGSEDVTITLSIDGTIAVNVDVPADATVQLGTGDDQSLVQGASPAAPGGLADVWFGNAEVGSFQEEVPVVDGTLAPYQDIIDTIPALPSPSASPSPIASASS